MVLPDGKEVACGKEVDVLLNVDVPDMEGSVAAKGESRDGGHAARIPRSEGSDKLEKRGFPFTADTIIDTPVSENVPWEKRRMRSAHHGDDALIHLFRDGGNLPGFPRIGGKRIRYGDDVGARLPDGVLHITACHPVAGVSPEQRERGLSVVTVEGRKFRETITLGMPRAETRPAVKYDHVAYVPYLGGDISERQRIGPDGRIVEILDGWLDEKDLHDSSIAEKTA